MIEHINSAVLYDYVQCLLRIEYGVGFVSGAFAAWVWLWVMPLIGRCMDAHRDSLQPERDPLHSEEAAGLAQEAEGLAHD